MIIGNSTVKRARLVLVVSVGVALPALTPANNRIERSIATPLRMPVQHQPGCAGDLDVPLEIRLLTDETKLAPNQTSEVRVELIAKAPLRDVRVDIDAGGAAKIEMDESLSFEFIAEGGIQTHVVSVRFLHGGHSHVTVGVKAIIDGTDFPFAKRAVLNVLMDEERTLVGREVPRHLQVRAVREKQRDGVLSQAQAETEIERLTRLDGKMDDLPFVPIARTPEEQDLVDKLRVTPVEPIATAPGTRGGVSLRVMGRVQWLDENGSIHPVYGMTVQVRDDETVGSDLVRVMATDANGQYDTGFFSHDDGFGAGNPDIFVRFRTENNAIDVEDGCFACGTYENDSAIHDEYPGGTIVQNLTCDNTGTGPACSVLTGLTWIAVYASNLNGGSFIDKVRADWPGDSGSSNYNCTPACRINVQPGDKWDWDVLHHEYGHHVMDEFDFEDNPGGPHSIGACLAVTSSDKDEGIKFAWAEGWPTFFGTAGQRSLNMASLNVPRVGDVNYSETEEATFTYSLESNTGDLVFPDLSNSGRGEDNELAVQRVLWDLFDNNIDGRDTVNVSDQTLWNLVTGGDPHSLSAAWAPIRAGLSNEQDLAFGAVTADHLIGPACASPAHNAVVSQAGATFSWVPNVGCDPSFAGNSFELVFYRASDHFEALRITGLTTTSYTLSASEYLTVRGFGPELKWAVEARNTASPNTGPYLGDNRTVFMYVTPSNDDCVNARSIGDGHVIGTTTAATADGSDSCIASSRPDVWFSYTASCTGFVTMSSCGSDALTSISIHDSCPGTFNNQLDCGDGLSCSSEARATVVAGNSYLVRAAAATTSPGDFQINTICTPQADSCDDALPIAIGGRAVGSTTGTAFDSAPACNGFDVTAPGVWFTVIGNGNELTASLCGPATNYDTKISVYCGGCVNPWCRGGNDDHCGTGSEVTWCSTPGAVHHILVHGYQDNVGDFELQVTDTGNYCGPVYLSCVPANNTCLTATELTQGEYTGDNTSSTTVGTASCRSSNSDVWYRFTPNCTGFITVSTCGEGGSLGDTLLTVYDECGGREIACNDDFPGCGYRSQVTVPVNPDEPILIRVASYGDTVDQGTFPLRITGAGMIAPVAVPPQGLYTADGNGFLEDCLLRLSDPGLTASAICNLGSPGVSALTYAEPLGLLYGIDDQPDFDSMVLVDPVTAETTPIGTLGFSAVQGLTYHPAWRTLLGSDIVTAQLVRVDPFSGEGSAIGPIGFSGVRALAYDAQSDILWGSDIATDQLITIDPVTGAGIAVGWFGPDLDRVEGLAVDYVAGVLYGVNQLADGSGELLTINTRTGRATRISLLVDMGPTALAFIPGLPDARVGEAYLHAVPVAGGCPTIFFGGATDVPDGMDLSVLGVLLGTPTRSGIHQLSFDVSDSDLSSPSIQATLPLRVRPTNDDCGDAQPANDGPTEFSTRGATTDGPDEPAACHFSGDPSLQADTWFCYTSTCTGELTVSTCGSSYDTKLAVYDGCTCPVTAPPLACDDDFCGTAGLQSSVSIAASAGSNYLIRMSGYAGTTGEGRLDISCAECVQDADCDDGDGCTEDSCDGGRCGHAFKTCDDGDLCTIDGCESTIGCTHDAVVCDDENACTSEVCNPGSGLCDISPIDCDDNDACTIDGCLPESGCESVLIDCDGDGVCDFDDNCLTVSNGNQSNTDGDAYGDACDGPFDEDHDGDVDALDYAGFAICLAGPNAVPSPACLEIHDGVQDLHVDLVDYAALQRMFGEPIVSLCNGPN